MHSTRRYIVTPTGNANEHHHLLPRFRHNHREPSGLMGKKTMPLGFVSVGRRAA